MSLHKSIGSTITKNQRSEIQNPTEGVEIDFYFTAERFAGSQTEISMLLWTIIVDSDGFAYAMQTNHLGNYQPWKEVIRERIKEHLFKLQLDSLQVKRLIRDIEIKKEGHILPYDMRMAGTNIGITGSDEIYLRKDRFKNLK